MSAHQHLTRTVTGLILGALVLVALPHVVIVLLLTVGDANHPSN